MKRSKKFRKSCELFELRFLKLKYDIVMCWDSAYAMLIRVMYLHSAIDQFIKQITIEDKKFCNLSMTFDKWNMCELLLTILLPFKRVSHSLQITSRSSIDEVFWIYETLFSKINQLKDTFHLLQYKDLT